MENKENLGIRDNKSLLPIVIIQGIVIMVLIIFVVIVSDNPDDQVIDYNRIEEIVDRKVSEVEVSPGNEVDYDIIADIVKENQADVEKDFGDKFEEMTTYFGDKFKDFIGTVNDKLQDNKKSE